MFARCNALAAIVVCGNPKIANNSPGKRYWVQNCSAAMENILIAAAGMDLGAVWIGMHPLPSVVSAIRRILVIPETVTPLGMAYVGYPAKSHPPHHRYDSQASPIRRMRRTTYIKVFLEAGNSKLRHDFCTLTENTPQAEKRLKPRRYNRSEALPEPPGSLRGKPGSDCTQ
jgi:hypothetical protein